MSHGGRRASSLLSPPSSAQYQTGVFLSRSSGTLCRPPLSLLYLAALLQLVNLAFFTYVGYSHLLYAHTPLLLAAALCTGLLGGAVYVHVFLLIGRDVAEEKRESSVALASAAESFGILLADVTGLVLQGCLFRWNGLEEVTAVRCPWERP